MPDIFIIKGLILFTLLVLASISDLRTHKVSDVYSILIASTAFIGTTINELLWMLVSSIVITMPMLIFAIKTPGGIGGADIKVIAACAFLLGVSKGLMFIILGLFLAVIANLILKTIKKSKYKEPFALLPYLSIACMAAYFC